MLEATRMKVENGELEYQHPWFRATGLRHIIGPFAQSRHIFPSILSKPKYLADNDTKELIRCTCTIISAIDLKVPPNHRGLSIPRNGHYTGFDGQTVDPGKSAGDRPP